MQFGKCNAVPVNTLPMAYTVRRSIRQWNVLTCSSVLTGGKRIVSVGRRKNQCVLHKYICKSGAKERDVE